MVNLEFKWRSLTRVGSSVILVRAMVGERAAWYYMLISRIKLHLLYKAAFSGSKNLKEFGKIVHSGWGDAPPPKVQAFFEEK